MARDNPVSRRTALKVTGAAATTAFIAGCSNDGGDGNGDENGDDGSEAVEISPEEDIELRSLNTDWEGVAPSGIEDQQNPTLSLEEGEEYTITWVENESSSDHNLAIYDDSEEPVEGPTDQTDEPGDDQELTFEASEDTVEYVCVPHEGAGMRGDIELQ